MLQQSRLFGAVELKERIPQILVIIGQAVGPALVALLDRLRRRAAAQVGRREPERHLVQRHLEAGFAACHVKSWEDHTFELRPLMPSRFAVFSLKKKK